MTFSFHLIQLMMSVMLRLRFADPVASLDRIRLLFWACSCLTLLATWFPQNVCVILVFCYFFNVFGVLTDG